MKKTTKYAVASLLTVGVTALVAIPAFAAGSADYGTIPSLSSINKGVSGSAVFGSSNLSEIIAGVISVILGFLGVITVLIILWGGFIWMTAAGEPDKVDKAKKMIYSGIIGLVIIFAAYAIANFVMSAIGTATGVGA